MKKYFVVTDVHGFFDEMMEALNDAGFDINNENHIFISLGDLLDRGNQPHKCLDFVNSIPRDRKILIYGNHECLLGDAIARGDFTWYDYSNGTVQTVNDLFDDAFGEGESATFSDFDKLVWLKDYAPYKEYIASTQTYEVINDKVFVHGWVPQFATNLRDLSMARYAEWYDAAWRNGMREYKRYGALRKNPDTKEIVTVFCGHWHTFWWRIHITHEEIGNPSQDLVEKMTKEEKKQFFRPVIEPGIVALDACTALSGIVNCYTFEE